MLIIIVLFCFILNRQQIQSKDILPIAPRIDADHINDTITEIFKDCRCVIYYQCDDNNNIISVGKNIFDITINQNIPRVYCTDDLYFCCRENLTSTTPIYERRKTETKSPLLLTQKNETSQIIYTNNNDNLKCGRQKTAFNIRILNDDNDDDNTSTVVPGEIPWMVSIFKKDYDCNYKFKCGGSLIHPQVVLTATHCIISAKLEDLKVVVNGKPELPKIGVETEWEQQPVKILKHPDYYSGSLSNNIGLIFLPQPYNLNDVDVYINTICLPSSKNNFIGMNCWTSGWGGKTKYMKSEQLHKVDVPIIPSNKCEQYLRKTRLGPDFELDPSQLCAGGEENKDTCYGDGGGPLVCFNNTQYYQVGIVSWGIQCGKGTPGIYTDVTKFTKWITEELKNFFNITL